MHVAKGKKTVKIKDIASAMVKVDPRPEEDLWALVARGVGKCRSVRRCVECEFVRQVSGRKRWNVMGLSTLTCSCG